MSAGPASGPRCGPGPALGAGAAPAGASGGAGRGFTDEQLEAVRRRSEPLLLAAGAGSGKTAVLVERFVRAVLDDGVSPAAILAITFTDRAAGELRERVRARFLELGRREQARDAEAAFVTTFHGFCARVLRAHALLAGVDPGFQILDEGLAAGLRARAFDTALAAFLAGASPPAVDLVASYQVDEARDMILAVFAALRSRGQRFPRLPSPVPGAGDDVEEAAGGAVALLDELLGRFGQAYEEVKRARGALDFDDLELVAKELLESHPGVRESWAERFELLMVDEFQDTNARQLAVVDALDRDNLFTVGDELQAIYGFRHADVGLFRARRGRLSARGGDLRLTGNFRGRPAVLAAVNAIFARRLGDTFQPLVARREEAGAEHALPAGDAPAQQSLFEPPAPEPAPLPRVELLLTARDGWDQPDEAAAALGAGLPAAAGWRRAEARALASRIAQLIASGEAEAGDVVVLLRATGDIEVYEHALRSEGLRTLAYVGGFWGRLETRDLLAYLRTLANPLDETALYCALASPLAGLSSDGLALVARAAQAAGRGAWSAATAIAGAGADGEGAAPEHVAEARARLAAPDRAALGRFCAHVEHERAGASRRPVSELLVRVMEASGYRERLLGLEWAERRLANVHKLQRVARRWEASEGGDLRGFLEHVERLEAARVQSPDAPVEDVERDTVRLMTIHSAKGLEFGVVCVADLGRGTNPRPPKLLVDGERVGLSLLRLDGAKAVPALEYQELCDERQRAEAAEEDRIFYVAMTRARERLLLSGATDLARLAESREGPPIGWLAPIVAGSVQAPDVLDPPVIDVSLEGPTAGGGAGARAVVRCRFNLAGRPGEAQPGAQLPREAEKPADGAVDAGSEPPRREAGAGAPGAAGGEPPPPPAQAGAGVGPPGPRLARLSYTALAELERCGYRYYLERVLRLGEDRPADGRGDGRGLEARVRGTLVHALLEADGLSAEGAGLAAALDRHAGALGLELAGGERGELAEMLATAGAAPLAARIAAADEVRREHAFAFALGPGEPLVTGVLDVLAREAGGGMLVVDYKTDRLGDGDPVALVERDYGLQRLLYALAVLREPGVEAVEVVHWYLERPSQPAAARYPAADLPELEAEFSRRVQLARERGYRVTPVPHRGLCATCPGRAALCSWEEEQTLRELVPGEAAPGGRREP